MKKVSMWHKWKVNTSGGVAVWNSRIHFYQGRKNTGKCFFCFVFCLFLFLFYGISIVIYLPIYMLIKIQAPFNQIYHQSFIMYTFVQKRLFSYAFKSLFHNFIFKSSVDLFCCHWHGVSNSITFQSIKIENFFAFLFHFLQL